MKKILITKVFSIGLTILWSISGFAEVKVIPETNTKAIVIENETIKMVIDPERGGAVVSFVHKKTKTDIVPRDKKYMGLFLDHMWGQVWPGELLEVPYEIQLVKSGPVEAIIKLSRRMKGDWQGTQNIFQGLVIEKTYSVYSGIDAVFCHIAVKNPMDEAKLSVYWLQNVFFIGGSYDEITDVFYRPSCRGIRESFPGCREKDFLTDPYFGWSAAIDKTKAEGIVFLMDYNYLDMLYNCNGNFTLEWMYDKIPVPAGKSWETDIILVPTKGIKTPVYAGKSFMAGLEIKREVDILSMNHQFRATLEPVQEFKISVEVLGAIDSKKTMTSVIKVGSLTTEPKTVVQSIKVNSTDPLVVFVTAEGKIKGEKFKETYFNFFAGNYGYGDNIQQDMITPVYKAGKPEKHQQLMKPDEIVRRYDGKLHIFILEGLHSQNYRIEEAIKSRPSVKEQKINYGRYSIGHEGPRVSDFPFDYNILMLQDLIIIGNVNIQCLGKLGLEMLKDYITHGGSLLFLGGKSSYGNGGIIGSGLENLLPVEVSTNLFDIEKNIKSELVLAQPDFLTKDLNLKTKPHCPYLHQINVKEGAKVLIKTTDNKPFFVVNEVAGGGRIACVLGAPYGVSTEDSPIFYNWEEWSKLLGNIIAWLVR